MLFNKKLATIAVLAGAMVSASAFAVDEPAKKGATVTFKALVRAASCDVTSSTQGSVVDWGVFTSDQLAGKAVRDQLGTTEKFDLMLSNCSKDTETTAINVFASGQQNTHFPELFSNAAAKSLAVKLTSNGTALKPNDDTALTLPAAQKAEGTSIPVEAALLLTQTGVTADALNVPVTFSVSYN